MNTIVKHAPAGPVAVVTGGAVRVGRGIALGLAEAGFDVAVNYHRSESEAREVSARIEAVGRRALPIRADVSRSGEIDGLLEKVRSRFGRMDLLVNNASLFQQSPFMEIQEEEWDRVMDVNVKGPFLMVQKAADLLADSGGSVVNVVDLSAFRPWREFPHHSVSKAALLHLTRVMARALAPRVRVNAVAPGSVLLPDDYTEEQKERARGRTALGELGAPEDVLRTILFLERSSFITGEVITVDGGQTLEG